MDKSEHTVISMDTSVEPMVRASGSLHHAKGPTPPTMAPCPLFMQAAG